MKIYAVYFSPGGSTKKCVMNVASGFEDIEVVEIDMTQQVNREKKFEFSSTDIVIIGMPTMSKLFGLPDEIMNQLSGNQTPCIPVVTCGNGYYGKGLIVLKSIMEKRGFKVIGAGGFVGQYSFDKSIAEGRPDTRDQEEQTKMGKAIYLKILRSDLSFDHDLKIDWPNEGFFSTIKCGLISYLPGSGGALPKGMRGLEVSDKCVACKKCINVCPMNAITYDEEIKINIDQCIGCFACGNVCPVSAISHTSSAMKKALTNVKSFRSHRKPNDIYV